MSSRLIKASLVLSWWGKPQEPDLVRAQLHVGAKYFQKVVPAAPGSEAIKEAKLVERKVCFISEARNRCVWGVGLMSKGLLPPLITSGQELLKGSLTDV